MWLIIRSILMAFYSPDRDKVTLPIYLFFFIIICSWSLRGGTQASISFYLHDKAAESLNACKKIRAEIIQNL